MAISYNPAGIRCRYDVEIWLKIGRQRRQRDISVILPAGKQHASIDSSDKTRSRVTYSLHVNG